MKLGEKSRRKIEEFFREHLNDASFRLPEIYFYAGGFSRILTRLLVIDGITIGRRIFIFADNIRCADDGRKILNDELAVHEIAHVLQYRRDGFFTFLRRYLNYYRENLKRFGSSNKRLRALAYYEIPYEIEAREIASRFSSWSRNRKVNG